MSKMGLVVVALLAGCVDMEGADDPSSPPTNEPPIGLSGSPSNGTIQSALTPFAVEGGQLFEMASDATHLYWMHIGEQNPVGVLKRRPLAGGPTELLTTVPARVYSLAVSGGFVYFTGTHDATGDYAGTVYKMPTTGGTPTVLATGFNPLKISVDGEWVYYSEGNAIDGRILRVRTSGGAPEVVACNVENPWDLVAKNGVVYYSEMNRGRMMRVVPGHSPVVLADGWCGTDWMTVDDSFVYFAAILPSSTCTAAFGNLNLYRVPRDGGVTEHLMTAQGVMGKLAIAGDHLVWGSALMSPDGGQPTFLNTDPTMVFSAVEARSDAVFFADYYTGAMYRSPL